MRGICFVFLGLFFPFLLLAELPKPSPQDFRQFGNQLRESGGAGVLLTPSFGKIPAATEKTRAELQAILEYIGAEAIAEKGIHVRVNIYSSFAPNAFALGPGQHTLELPYRRLLGFAEDGKPVYEIAVPQGMLSRLKIQAHAASFLGHELGHIIRGDTEKVDLSKLFLRYWDTQALELDADFFALDLMNGKYDLDEFYRFMFDLISGNVKLAPGYAFAEDHHHPSLRLASILARVFQLQQITKPDNSKTEPLFGNSWRSMRASAREDAEPEYPPIRWQRWFWSFLQPHAPPAQINSDWWHEEHLKVLPTSSLTPGEIREVFSNTLTWISENGNLDNTEKIERLFEVLLVFTKDHHLLRNAFVQPSMLSVLGAKEMGELKSFIKKFSFSATDSWDWETLLSVFSSRVSIQNEISDDGRSYTANHVLRHISGHPRLEPLFHQLSRASNKWAALQNKVNRFSWSGNYSELADEIIAFMETDQKRGSIFPEGFLDALDESVTTFLAGENVDYGAVKEFIFDCVLILRDLEKRSPSLANKFEQVIRQMVPQFQRRAKKVFEMAVVKDPGKLAPADLSRHYWEISDTMRRSLLFLKKRGAGTLEFAPSELRSSIRDLWKWVDQDEDFYRSHLPAGDRIFNHGHNPYSLMDMANQFIEYGLAEHLWSPTEAEAIYLRLILSEKFSPDSAYLRSLSTSELRSFFLMERPHLLRDASVVRLLETLTGLRSKQIHSLGLSDLLLKKKKKKAATREIIEAAAGELRDITDVTIDSHLARFWRMSTDKEVAERFLSSLSVEEFQSFMLEMEAATIESGVLNDIIGYSARYRRLERLSSEPLISALLKKQREGMPFAVWARIYQTFSKVSDLDFNPMEIEIRKELAEYLDQNLAQVPNSQRLKLLHSPGFLSLLFEERAAFHLAEAFLQELPANLSTAEKGQRFQKLQEEYKLKSLRSQINYLLERMIAERLNLQPGEIAIFFSDKSSFLKTTDFSGHIRGMSGIIAYVQTLPVADQIEFVEFILGRKAAIPTSVSNLQNVIIEDGHREISLPTLLYQARAKLASETSVVRSLAVLPFFTGKTSMAGTPKDTEEVLKYIFRSLSEDKREFAHELAKGILEGEGKNAPMAFAFLFGQVTSDGKPLSEGQILRGLFYAYGVPGTKYAQYLAFSSEYGALRDALSETQDQAMPISYLEAVQLLEERFPKGLENGYRIIGIKGTGSVNIGIEYYNPISRENEILSIPREAIEVSAERDFNRFRRVLASLTSTPEGKKKFGFALGLDDLVEQSVNLEFNREQVFRNHLALYKSFGRSIDGWNVRYVEPYAIENGVIRMQMAKGTPARLVLEANPSLYRSAMLAASQAFGEHLLRKPSVRIAASVYFADSDFHDGQVFIDKKTRTVWLIDPGQSVEISESEFQVAKFILRIISGTVTPENALHYIHQSVALNPHKRNVILTLEELRSCTQGRDTDDAFIKLVGKINTGGGHVPLPVAQWVLGMNRQRVLNQKLGASRLQRQLFPVFLKDSLKAWFEGEGSCAEITLLARKAVGF